MRGFAGVAACALLTGLAACGGGGTGAAVATTAVGKSSTPTLAQSLNLTLVSGKASIRLPGHGSGSRGFVALPGQQLVPVGTQVDARHGVVEVAAASTTPYRTQTGRFGGAIFSVSQSGSDGGLTTLTLLEDLFAGAPGFASCPAPSPRIIQMLRSQVEGHFRTVGKFSAATVRGTSWTMEDRCDGSWTRVQQGTVVVQDFVRHLTVTVHAGHQYLAKAH